MTLLLALIGLGAFYAMPDDWRRILAQPARAWLRLLAGLPDSLPLAARLLMVMGIPMLVLFVLLQGLREAGLGLLAFLPSALVLLVVFGDITLPRALDRFTQVWQSRYGSAEPASVPADGAGVPADEEQTDWVTGEVTLDAELSQARVFLLRENLHELFAPLFWFLLAGPAAALGYYLLRLQVAEAGEQTRQTALGWLQVADWVPTRLLALSFALAGNFTATWQMIRERLVKVDACGHELIDHAAAAAEPEGLDDDIDSPVLNLSLALTRLQALMQRSLIVWMVFLALQTLWPGF